MIELNCLQQSLVPTKLKRHQVNLLLLKIANRFSASQMFEGDRSPPATCRMSAWHNPSAPMMELLASSVVSHRIWSQMWFLLTKLLTIARIEQYPYPKSKHPYKVATPHRLQNPTLTGVITTEILWHLITNVKQGYCYKLWVIISRLQTVMKVKY